MKTFKQRRGWQVAVAALLVIGAGVGLIWRTNALGWRYWRWQEVEQYWGATLPAGTQFATQPQPTRIVWLRVPLAAGSTAEDFLAQRGYTLALQDGYTPFPAPNPQESGWAWWQPFNARHYAGLQVVEQSRRMVEVLADWDAQALYIRLYELHN